MATIAIDIDSTLYDFETPAREAYLKLAHETGDKTLFRGAYMPWTEFRSPVDVCGPEVFSKVVEMCHDDDVILDQTPFSGAVETVNALHENGHSILYISNRATESRNATQEWLAKWGFPLIETKLFCLMGDKKPHIADCQYIIDDRPKTLIDFIYDWTWEWELRQDIEAMDFVTEDHEREWRSKHMRRGFGLMFRTSIWLRHGAALISTWWARGFSLSQPWRRWHNGTIPLATRKLLEAR
jgi:5'(3')-deoxyribonucleotidase